MMRTTGQLMRAWLPVAVLAMTLAAPATQALVSGERERTCRDGVTTYSDYFGGTYTGDPSNPFAPFRVVIPDEGWNGKLLAYARGTGSSVKLRPFEVDDELVDLPVDVDDMPLVDPTTQAPLLGFTPLNNALPEITAGGPVLPADPDAFEDYLVCDQKYAAVVSDYKPDFDFLLNGKLGWVVEDGVRDIGLALAQARRLLRSTKGRLPSRTILIGRSQGSIIALRYAEERSLFVDGVITACTVGAGTSRSWDTAVDVALAVDVAFSLGDSGTGGWIWGAPGDVGDVNDGVVFATDVAPWLIGQFPDEADFAKDPGAAMVDFRTAFARFEFVRLVTGLPLEGFYPFNPHDIYNALPDVPGLAEFNWLGTILLFATEVKADVETKAGGAVGQNLDHSYSLSIEDREYLSALGIDEAGVNAWLDQMNGRTNYEASTAGAAYTAKYRDFSFDTLLPPRPMLSIHTTTDGLVLPSQETVLRETLDAAGGLLKQRQLRQTFVNANGHCSLTQAEWEKALNAMENRLDHGVWPGDWFFPDNGDDLRFNNMFDPGPFPQPAAD